MTYKIEYQLTEAQLNVLAKDGWRLISVLMTDPNGEGRKHRMETFYLERQA